MYTNIYTHTYIQRETKCSLNTCLIKFKRVCIIWAVENKTIVELNGTCLNWEGLGLWARGKDACIQYWCKSQFWSQLWLPANVLPARQCMAQVPVPFSPT